MEWALAVALSQHLSLGDYNSVHPHIRVQDDKFIAGAYLNSFNQVSPYMGLRFEFEDHGIEIGAVGGYPDNAFYGLTPYARYTYDLNDNSRLFVAPVGETDQYDNFYLGSVIGIEVDLNSK